MDLQSFRASLDETSPPDAVGPCLKALWYDAKGNWEAAHNAAQDVESRDGSWVHGYLHRVEGDNANAGYWYRRAGKPFPEASLPDEWSAIAESLLADDG